MNDGKGMLQLFIKKDVSCDLMMTQQYLSNQMIYNLKECNDYNHLLVLLVVICLKAICVIHLI